jgi:hypothetical protein
MPITTRFWHTGAAVVFRISDTLAITMGALATPATFLDSATIIGTCERYPQISSQVVREEVRNDIGGDKVIARPCHGHNMVLDLELNMWDETVLDALLASDQGGGGTRTGTHNVLTLGTMVDIAGNSSRIFVYYPDETNRPKQGILIPMASVVEHAPVKIGNRTAAHKLRLESNTYFLASGGTWTSLDFYEYKNTDPDIDATLKPMITG